MLAQRGIRHLAAYLIAIVSVFGGAAALWRVPAITAGAAAPLLLLAVLFIARSWGTGPALAGSASAGLAFTYYFLPLSGRFIEDLNDWVAFLTFMIAAVVVGELSARAERRQIEAEEGRLEIEQLYQQLGMAFERASEAEAARRNEQLKAALLEALTHNLRTPLTAIKASVTGLLGSGDAAPAGGLTQEGRRELLHVIDEESDRLNRFIEGLSAADRARPMHATSLHQVKLEAIVDDALRRAGTVLRRHHVSTTIDPRMSGLPVDAGAVAEVLYILLDNASKYAPAGTAIRIEAVPEGEHQVRITVSDEGPGIPDDLRERVFEKFFRIPGREPSDPRRGGVGLGLPIARRLMETQAGEIWIEARPGVKGTRVVLRLPGGGQGSQEPSEVAAAQG
jgi:two-component system sensor histidine kinase KdpD